MLAPDSLKLFSVSSADLTSAISTAGQYNKPTSTMTKAFSDQIQQFSSRKHESDSVAMDDGTVLNQATSFLSNQTADLLMLFFFNMHITIFLISNYSY